MPKLENLKQAQILQVTNPTGAVSAASLGAAASDGYADLGRALQNTEKVISEIAQVASVERNKLKAGEYERRAAEIQADAKAYARRESKDPLGTDKVGLYQEKFQELMDGYLGTQEDSRLKRQAVDTFKNRMTEGYIDMRNGEAVDAVKGLNNMRVQAFKERSGKIYNDIALSSPAEYDKIKGGFLKVIEDNNAEIDNSTMVYSKDQIPFLKSTEASELGVTAIKAFVARKDFRGATDALGVLLDKQYIDGNTADKLKTQIGDAQYEAKNRYLSDVQRGEKLSDEVVLQTQQTIIARSIADLSQITSPQDQKAYVDMRRLDLDRGLITVSQFKEIEGRAQKMVDSPMIKFKEDYTQALDALNRGEDITDMVTEDINKNKYHPAVGRQLIQAQMMRDGITKDTKGSKGGTRRDAFMEAGKILNETKNMFNPRERLEIQEKVTTETLNGKDPVEAAKLAVADTAKRVVQKNRAAPGVNPAISLIKGQTTLEDLDRIAPMIKQEAQRARARGNDAQGVEILKTLKMQRQLLGASGSNEVINERRR